MSTTLKINFKDMNGQLTNLLILGEAEYIHCLQHLTIQLHIIFTSYYRHIAICQIAVAANVVFY